MPGAHQEILALLVAGATYSAFHLYRAQARRRAWSRRDDLPSELRVILEVVARDAARRDMPEIVPEHLLLAALLDDDVVGVIEALGGCPVLLRAILEEHLFRVLDDPGDSDGREIPPSTAVLAVMVEARARAAAEGRAPAPIDLLPALCSVGRGFAADLLEAAGASAAMDLAPSRAGSGARAQDDAGTPYRRLHAVDLVLAAPDPQAMAGTVEVIRSVFGSSWMEANHVALTARHQGSAVAGTYPDEQAAVLLERAAEEARALGVSLRLTQDRGASRRPPRARTPFAPEVKIAFRLAEVEAARRRHAEVTAEHVIHAILFEDEVASLARRAGGRPEAVLGAPKQILDEREASERRLLPPPSRALHRVTQRAVEAARHAGADRLTGTQLLLGLCDDEGTPGATVLAKHGVTRRRLEGAPPAQGSGGSALPSGIAAVVFHNDDRTPMAAVAYILESVFQRGETAAMHVTLSVHFRGSAVAGVYPRAIAAAKVAEVEEIRRQQGWPLRLTLEDTLPATSP